MKAVNGQFKSTIGEFYSTEESISSTSSVSNKVKSNTLLLLLKSQAIEKDSSLLIDQLSFYSDVLLAFCQQITIKIKPHTYQVFSRYRTKRYAK